MESSGRRHSKVVRRLAMISIATLAVSLTASATVTSAATHPSPGDSKTTNPAGGPNLTAADSGDSPTIHAIGAIGIANSTTANPKAAGLPRARGGVAVGDSGIPATALAAYRKAAATLVVEDPSCHLTWPVLAGHRQGRDRPRPQLGVGEPHHG